MTDLPNEIMVWHSMEKLTHIGTWATERYPEEAVAYVPLADAQAAQAMVVERAAAKADRGHGTYCRARGRDPEKYVSAFYLMAREIRALAPIDGLALVRELRDRAEKAEADTRRLVVAATNPSGQKCNACRATGLTHCADPFNCGGMVDYKVDEAIETVENLLSAWKAARIERDRLAAANAALEAKVAGLHDLLGRGAMHVSLSLRAWHEDVRAALRGKKETS